MKSLKSAYQTALGVQASISGRTGAADIRFLNKYANTPTVIFGPGPTDQMHATNEYAKIDDVIAATKVYSANHPGLVRNSVIRGRSDGED